MATCGYFRLVALCGGESVMTDDYLSLLFSYKKEEHRVAWQVLGKNKANGKNEK
jgi:hypothetical protein